MLKNIIKIYRKIQKKRRDYYYKSLGIKIGLNSKIEKGVFLDPSFPWLIEIGNNVTIAPRVFVLTHDGSTKNYLGYSKIGRVVIEDNVFIGANSVILPNIKIGKNSIVGSNSVITKDVPSDVVIVGNPAKIISTTADYVNKNKSRLENAKIYEDRYKRDFITEEMKLSQIRELEGTIGFID